MQKSQPLLGRERSEQDHSAAEVEENRTGRQEGRYWVVAGVVLLGIGSITASQHVAYDAGFHYSHYLDEVGSAAVGLCLSGCIQLSFGLAILSMLREPDPDTEAAALAFVMRKGATNDSTSMSAVFGENAWTLTRTSTLALELASWGSNLVSFALAVHGALLRKRDPDHPMDFVGHMMPAVELSFSVCLLIIFVLGLIKHSIAAEACAHPSFNICKCYFRYGSSFSSASFLGIGYDDLMGSFDPEMSIPFALSNLLLALFELMIGVFALMAKVASLSFVGSDLMTEWSPAQWLSLLVFANNVLKMGRSFDQITTSDGELFYNELVATGAETDQEDQLRNQRLQSLSRDLMSTYGRFQGLAIFATFTRTEARKMFQFDCFQNRDIPPRSS